MSNSEIQRILGELAGYASMCWEPTPDGEFQSEDAAAGVRAAVLELVTLLTTAVGDLPQRGLVIPNDSAQPPFGLVSRAEVLAILQGDGAAIAAS